MRLLAIMRGSMGCGKSTWIKEHGLENYTLSADDIRMLIKSPVLTLNGGKTIPQDVNKQTWDLLFDLLETRMKTGEFTIVDACNTKTIEMNKYLTLAKLYRYRVFCIDFTNIPIEVAKARNTQRPIWKQVPEASIDNAYARFQTQKIPSGIDTILPEQFDEYVKRRTIDLNKYKKIVVVGDVHGCYSALCKAVPQIDDDTFYIFLGDYLDRGLEIPDMMNFLLENYTKENIIFLEGNHEEHLWKYAHDLDNDANLSFSKYTIPEIATVDKKSIRKMMRSFLQAFIFTFGGGTFYCTHAGLPTFKDLYLTSTRQIIHGCGKYEDVKIEEQAFSKVYGPNEIQFHGHRNTDKSPIFDGFNSYNLEGKVEFGGDLRAVSLTKDKSGKYKIETIEIPNDIFKLPSKDEAAVKAESESLSIEEAVKLMSADKINFMVKTFDNIKSYNFTRDVFFNKTWNANTIRARGLFINDNNEIVCRGFSKFFNIGENTENSIPVLKQKLKFPLSVYLKYNGFLGLLGYDNMTNSLKFCSKSTVGGEYAEIFKDIFMNTVSQENIEKITEYLKVNNQTLVFEVISPSKDPHIIEYENEQIVLLDSISNNLDFSHIPYNDLVDFGKTWGIKTKERLHILQDAHEFEDFISQDIDTPEYKHEGKYIEGFVFEDQDGYMTKFKTPFYTFWKGMRGIAESVFRKDRNGNYLGYIKNTGKLTTPEANLFYKFITDLAKSGYSGDTHIITLRNLYLNKDNSNQVE